MLNWIFNNSDEPASVEISKDELVQRLGLNHKRFEPAPGTDNLVLAYLDRLGWKNNVTDKNSSGSIFYPAQEDENANAPAEEEKAADGYDDDEEEKIVKRPDFIAFAEYDLPHGKRGFALVIRQNELDFSNKASALIFGMYGSCDENGRMSVDRILMPSKEMDGSIKAVGPVDITDDTVRRAVLYAELCVREIYENDKCSPGKCLNKAVHTDLRGQSVKILPPAP